MDDVMKKYRKLQEYLRSLGSVAVALSSGVDSHFYCGSPMMCWGIM